MGKEDKQLKNFLNTEDFDSNEFETSNDFTKNVIDDIDYRILMKSQFRKTVLIIGVLLFFLFSIVVLYYFDGIYNIKESVNIKLSGSFWRYQYIPIGILSLLIFLVLDFRKQQKQSKFR